VCVCVFAIVNIVRPKEPFTFELRKKLSSIRTDYFEVNCSSSNVL
jgi:hypothetical protein